MSAFWIKINNYEGKFNFWDKPKRNKNKLNLDGITRAKIKTCTKKRKEEILKQWRADHV